MSRPLSGSNWLLRHQPDAAGLNEMTSSAAGLAPDASRIAPIAIPAARGAAHISVAIVNSNVNRLPVIGSARSLAHDRRQTLAQIAARGGGDGSRSRRHAEATRTQDRLGVDALLVALVDDSFVARRLALAQQVRAEPPHQRMEPEQHFDAAMNRGGQVVAAANVTGLVREDGLQLLRPPAPA